MFALDAQNNVFLAVHAGTIGSKKLYLVIVTLPAIQGCSSHVPRFSRYVSLSRSWYVVQLVWAGSVVVDDMHGNRNCHRPPRGSDALLQGFLRGRTRITTPNHYGLIRLRPLLKHLRYIGFQGGSREYHTSPCPVFVHPPKHMWDTARKSVILGAFGRIYDNSVN